MGDLGFEGAEPTSDAFLGVSTGGVAETLGVAGGGVEGLTAVAGGGGEETLGTAKGTVLGVAGGLVSLSGDAAVSMGGRRSISSIRCMRRF